MTSQIMTQPMRKLTPALLRVLLHRWPSDTRPQLSATNRGPWARTQLWERIVVRVFLTLSCGLLWAGIVLAVRAIFLRS